MSTPVTEANYAMRERDKEMPEPKHGDLRVWHIPQIPGRPFFVPVDSLAQGRLLLDVLADYDLFQLANRIKPDYSNAGGLSEFDANDTEESDAGSWCDWTSDDGDDIFTLSHEQIAELDAARATN